MNLAYAVNQVGMTLIVAERLGTLGGGTGKQVQAALARSLIGVCTLQQEGEINVFPSPDAFH